MEHTIDDAKKIISDCYESFEQNETDLNEVRGVFSVISSWDTDLPFVSGIRTIGITEFSDEEQLCMLLLLDDIFHDGLIPLQYHRFNRHPQYESILNGIPGLLGRGILRYEGAPSDAPEKNSNRIFRYYVTPRVLGLLFRGHPGLVSYKEIVRQADVIPSASIQRKDLFFNSCNQADVERIRQILSQGKFLSVMERLRSRGRRASASFLLYGEPGTGKTELAKQLASSTGRDVIIADVSKLHSSFTGDTEKNYREMFNSYRYLQSLSLHAPILLFNEADAILSKRGDVLRQAIDKIANRVQNLLLQELEDFEGIFIATTNRADNLDPAFERRFLYKINLQQPDVETRIKIWDSLLPDLTRKETEALANNYKLSGGQIYNIATRFDIDAALFDKRPSFQDLISFCETELIECDALVSESKPNRILEFEIGNNVLS